MILGIGTDIVKTSRIKTLLIKNKQRFLSRILTINEINLTSDYNNIDRLTGYVAKRFAAKEACAKALGKGIGKYLSFHDVEIFKDINGKPYFEFNSKIKNLYPDIKSYLSMADEKEFAQAFVVMEKI